ncbi:MAG: adenine deaminase [Acidaminococcaceae bacterium]|nr:adenine deaminase [Acidaminococcaceae bacterium]MBO6182786.1 adenine deaminase [Acidaminococcaceae bacterium]
MDFWRATTLEEQIDTAMGRQEADLVLKGGNVFNVFLKTWEVADVAISGSKIVGIGQYKGRQEIDVKGLYLTPGLMDAHVHFESSMLSPREMVKVLLLNGVTGAITDPHEITNVLGEKGLRFMLDETANIPFSAYLMIPSCVPATDMDTSGARITPEDMEHIRKLSPRILGLAEMMNFPGILGKQQNEMNKMKLFYNQKVDGHAPGLSGKELNAYVAAGITTEHECVTPAEAWEKVRRGMYVFMREGSAAHNLVDLLPLLKKPGNRRLCLCTDDRHADDLIEQGSINYLLEIGVAQGYDPEDLIPMATLNIAECYGLKHVGALAPGYVADIAVFENLQSFQPVHVIKGGVQVVKNRKLLWKSDPVLEPPGQSMNMRPATVEDFRIPAKKNKKLRVIGISQTQLLTSELHLTPTVQNGEAVSDVGRDILKMAVFERHHNTGNIGLGFAFGFGLKKGAIATTVGHDSHNLSVVGTNDEDMAVAVNRLREIGGGLIVVSDGEVRATVPLAIAGLMSDRDAMAVNSQIKQLNFWLKELGVPEEYSTFMILAFTSLPVIPELRLTDRGLVDVVHFEHVDLWCE